MSLQTKLIDWFEKNQRPLPWRKRYDPYEVLVSEIMLQQTQVETALPYFRRWMKAFPTMESLAKSPEKKVLKLWQGLGYYSRARNLHESAKLVVKKRGGRFPENYEDLLALKGVGRYTAGAIASIAFNQEKPIVDGNVLRVLSRIYAIKKPVDDTKNREEFWKLEASLIPKGKARNFNQALMELGALVCLPKNPLCAVCPINGFCEAYRWNKTGEYPLRRERKKTVKVEAACLVVLKNGRYLIRRRPEGEIMGGLWEFPEWKLARGKRLELSQIRDKVSSLAASELGIALNDTEYLGAVKRNYTHHNERMQVYLSKLPEKRDAARPRQGWPEAWITQKDFEKYPFSSAHAKIAELLKNIFCKNQTI